MKAPFSPGEREENETDKGLRVADRGYLNTAVMRSEITYIDGEAGGKCSIYSVNISNLFVKVLRYRYDLPVPFFGDKFENFAMTEDTPSNNSPSTRLTWRPHTLLSMDLSLPSPS